MSIEDLKSKADLRRFLERELAEKKGMVNMARIAGGLPYERVSGEASGSAQLSWPGGSSVSDPVDIPHELNEVPTGIWFSLNGPLATASVIITNHGGVDATNLLSVRATTVDGSSPPVGAVTSFSWLARL